MIFKIKNTILYFLDKLIAILKKIFISIVNIIIKYCGSETVEANEIGLKTNVWLVKIDIKKKKKKMQITEAIESPRNRGKKTFPLVSAVIKKEMPAQTL